MAEWGDGPESYGGTVQLFYSTIFSFLPVRTASIHRISFFLLLYAGTVTSYYQKKKLHYCHGLMGHGSLIKTPNAVSLSEKTILGSLGFRCEAWTLVRGRVGACWPQARIRQLAGQHGWLCERGELWLIPGHCRCRCRLLKKRWRPGRFATRDCAGAGWIKHGR